MFSDEQLLIIALLLEEEEEEERRNKQQQQEEESSEDELQEEKDVDDDDDDDDDEEEDYVPQPSPPVQESQPVKQTITRKRKQRVKPTRERKRVWVHHSWENRATEGEFATLHRELRTDPAKYFKYFRMSENSFNLLLSKLEVTLKKQDTFWRKAIPTRERLAVCLRYLTIGGTLKAISDRFCMGRTTVQHIVHETCRVITENLTHELMPTPTNEMWKNIALDFHQKCFFPNCIGVLEGKDITVNAHKSSNTFSLVMLALIDANCNFITVDVGEYSDNDGGVFQNSNLGKSFQSGLWNIPLNSTIPGTDIEVPYSMIGNEAFPLKTFLMRPYPSDSLDDQKRNFNQRISYVRITSDKCFEILTKRFKIYNTQIKTNPKHLSNVILATCLLHNFINKHDGDVLGYITHKEDSGQKGHKLRNLHLQGGKATSEAYHYRDVLSQYFASDAGSAPLLSST